jgi:hypothetical protein
MTKVVLLLGAGATALTWPPALEGTGLPWTGSSSAKPG